MRAAQARSKASNMLAASKQVGGGNRGRLVAFVILVVTFMSLGVAFRRGPVTSQGSEARSTNAKRAVRVLSTEPAGLSRPTEIWHQLSSSGLYDEKSNYVVPKAPYKELEDAKNKWEAQVMAEYPTNGCKIIANASGVLKKRCLPKLMIIGQFKAGTTAFYDTLAQHPGILLPYSTGGRHKCPMKRQDCAIKEVNGFTRLDEGDRWKEQNLLARYRDLLPDQELDDDRVVLEASPYYLSGMVDAYEDLTRFTRYIPGFKAIAVVRNPVDRAFSDWLMLTEGPFRQKSKGCAHGHGITFEDLIAEELEVRSPSLLVNLTRKSACLRESNKFQNIPPLLGKIDYKGRLARWGEYAHYAEAWMRTLPPENLMFVKTEALEQNSSEVLPAIQRWIGVKQIIQDMPLVHSNYAGCRGSIARGAWTEQRKAEAAAGLCNGAGARAKQQHMSQEVSERLVEHFREHNRRFQELTGISTADWDQGPITYGPPKVRLRDRARRRRRTAER